LEATLRTVFRMWSGRSEEEEGEAEKAEEEGAPAAAAAVAAAAVAAEAGEEVSCRPPPHLHLISRRRTASFRVLVCSLLVYVKTKSCVDKYPAGRSGMVCAVATKRQQEVNGKYNTRLHGAIPKRTERA
jgi:hypothetical protein